MNASEERFRFDDLAVSEDGSAVAAVCVDGGAGRVMDLRTGETLAAFKPVWDTGGRRLALSHDARLVASAQYAGEGVGVYDLARGRPVWRRRDLQTAQAVIFAGPRLLVVREKGGGVWLDAADGRTVEKLPRTRDAYVGAGVGRMLVERDREGPYEVVDVTRGERFAVVERTSFGLLAAAFAKDALFVSEADGPVSAYAVRASGWETEAASTGKKHRRAPAAARLSWRSFTRGSHALELAARAAEGEVLGVVWKLEQGGPKVLAAWNMDDGALRRSLPLPEHAEAAFSPDGERLVLSTGEVLRTHDASVVHVLREPTR